MEFQSIGSSNANDAFYRYKMPKMVAKTESRGNGIKKNVVNMADIAKALGRPASHISKYFGYELDTLERFNEKTGNSMLNGQHDTMFLAGLLETFIQKYVQCYRCGNPETKIVITKAEMITLQCAACGFVSNADIKDKFQNFVVKNAVGQKTAPKDKKAARKVEKEEVKKEAAIQKQKI